jgi:hypothetical protein
MEEPHYARVEREAAERLATLLALPTPDQYSMGGEGIFDPWEPFLVYGSYSSEFDDCAIDVLTELVDGEKRRHDLGAEMFREMLCKLELCTYGTSPRVCFPTERFKPLLPVYLEKWRAYYAVQWAPANESPPPR